MADPEAPLRRPSWLPAAPAVTWALFAAGADVTAIAESHHSLEVVRLELIEADPEVPWA